MPPYLAEVSEAGSSVNEPDGISKIYLSIRFDFLFLLLDVDRLFSDNIKEIFCKIYTRRDKQV